MNRLLWSLATAVARMLEPDERDALLGDLTEARVPPHTALSDTLGLVLRRQLAIWTTRWQPWVALLTIVIPVGGLLSLGARGIADASAIDLYLYVNNWTSGYFASPGARSELSGRVLVLALNYATLVSWSVAAAIALRSIAGRAIPSVAVLFGLMLFLFEKLPDGPRFAHNAGNAVVFDVPYYAAVHPVLVQVCAVLIPFVCALFVSPRLSTQSVVATCVWAVLVLVLTLRAAGGIFFWIAPVLPLWMFFVLPRPILTVGPVLLIAWPAAFMTVYAAVGALGRGVRRATQNPVE